MSSANPTSNDAPEPPLQWSKRLQDGTFRCSYKDGSVYTGELQGGKRHGQGAQTWTDGDTYSGSWVDDKRHGLGKVSLRFLVFGFWFLVFGCWFLVQLIGQLSDDVPFGSTFMPWGIRMKASGATTTSTATAATRTRWRERCTLVNSWTIPCMAMACE